MANKSYSFEALNLVNNGQDDLLSNIVYLATELLGCEVSIISVAQNLKEKHFISASFGLPKEDEETRYVDFAQSVCRIVYEDDKPLVITDLLADPRTGAMLPNHHFGYRSYIGVPIHNVLGKPIGSICCMKAVKTEWCRKSIDLLQRLSLEIDDIIKSRTHALELEETNAKLVKLLATRSSFSSHLSHEVRTPLTGMVGAIRLLSLMNLEGQAGNLVDVLDRSSMGLLKIVNDTLDFAKLDIGHFKLSEESCNLGQLARDIVGSYRDLAEKKAVLVKVDDKLGETTYLADRQALTSVLNNLFSNAVKFTNAGCARIILKRGQFGLIELEVVDTGIGIPEASHAIIFEEFQQADPSIARNYGGTGLGMAIVKRLVEMMNGDIYLTSEVGKGTAVTVLLPLKINRSEH